MSEPTHRRANAFAIVLLSLVQLACGAAGESIPTNVPKEPSPGTLVVVLQPRGNGRDADGFTATIDGVVPRALAYDAKVVYDSLSAGDHTVSIAGIAPHCSASAETTTRTTRAGATDTITVGMTCLGGFAYVEAVDATSDDILYLAEDGRTIRLATGPGRKIIESWSPDGTRLIYSTYEGIQQHLYLVRTDGTGTGKVASGPGSEWSPQWSPDGTRIAYVKGDAMDGSIYVAISDPDGANMRPLVDKASSEYDVTWSADGSRLYFGCVRFQRRYDLCSSALDGSDVRPLRYAALEPFMTPCTPFCMANLLHFAASPDGSTIAFEVGPLQGTVPQRVWAAKLDATSAIPLSGNTISFAGRWSPSGDRMLLNVNDGGSGYALATVNRDGTAYRQITSYSDAIGSGAWSPDGMVIAYDDTRAGQIGVMNADGSGRRLLTTGPFRKFAPIWNPKARAVGSLSAL